MIQYVINTVLTASMFMLVGVGFALVFQITRFFHFAHAVVFTGGAYLTYLFTQWQVMPLWCSIVLGVVLSTVIGCLMEVCIYLPLRKKGSGQLALLLASLGVYVFLQNTVSMFFGDATKSIRTGIVQEGLDVLGGRITPVQVVIVSASIMLVIVLSMLLRTTKTGKSMRAVANDPALADVSGIDSDRVILWAFAIGSGLAGLAGILVALDVDMTPTMGMNFLMMGIVAMIIGGVNSIPGIALGALLLATAQHLGAWYIGSQWQDAIAFVILVVFLLFKPEGFFGEKVKSATV